MPFNEFSKIFQKRTAIFSFIAFILAFPFSAQTVSSARTLISASEKKDNVTDSISYIKKNISSLASDSEKRAALSFLGGLQEQMGLYTEAGESFIKAASLAGGNISGLPKKTTEELILDAVRCGLSCGDWENAYKYLSSVKDSKNDKTLAYVKLYREWTELVKAENSQEVKKTAENLEKYRNESSMEEVKPLVLLTLWHITGEKKYSDELKSKYSGTLEESIVKGKVNLTPSPFWYFVPRVKSVSPDTTVVAIKENEKEADVSSKPKNESNTEKKSDLNSEKAEEKKENKNSSAEIKIEKQEKIRRQQLGLYKSEENAKALVGRLKLKGFKGNIESEIRPSGTKYYIVTVDENPQGNMGDLLRTAGFECYPVF